jgi:hypothetical protein
MGITFSTIDRDGRTYVDEPKRQAYAYMARLQVQGRQTSLTVENGQYKVESAGLAPIIFCGETT